VASRSAAIPAPTAANAGPIAVSLQLRGWEGTPKQGVRPTCGIDWRSIGPRASSGQRRPLYAGEIGCPDGRAGGLGRRPRTVPKPGRIRVLRDRQPNTHRNNLGCVAAHRGQRWPEARQPNAVAMRDRRHYSRPLVAQFGRQSRGQSRWRGGPSRAELHGADTHHGRTQFPEHGPPNVRGGELPE
jgi:hypothetical protein